VRSHTRPELVRLRQIVRADGDKTTVADFHLMMELDQTFRLPPVFGAVPSAAEHNDQRVRPLQIGEFPTFSRVICQFVIGKYSSGDNVSSHISPMIPPSPEIGAGGYFRNVRF
jgi:hypothetical protein